MQTLTYGYKKPETNDRGSVVFPAMEDNITRLNGHNHDGSNSAQLPATSMVATTQTILAADWVDQTNGMYRQLVTLPAGFTYDTVSVNVRLTSGHYIYPTIEKVSATTMYVYINDNSLDLKLVYR